MTEPKLEPKDWFDRYFHHISLMNREVKVYLDGEFNEDEPYNAIIKEFYNCEPEDIPYDASRVLEINEWYLVTNSKITFDLIEAGEIIARAIDGHYWGRPSMGSPAHMDTAIDHAYHSFYRFHSDTCIFTEEELIQLEYFLSLLTEDTDFDPTHQEEMALTKLFEKMDEYWNQKNDTTTNMGIRREARRRSLILKLKRGGFDKWKLNK